MYCHGTQTLRVVQGANEDARPADGLAVVDACLAVPCHLAIASANSNWWVHHFICSGHIGSFLCAQEGVVVLDWTQAHLHMMCM